jgi:uncharacterized protein YybS (DUF2232 family)
MFERRPIYLTLFAVFLAAMTGIFSALPLYTLKRNFSRYQFVAFPLLGAGILAAAGLKEVAAGLFLSQVLVGVFHELEHLDFSLFSSGILTILTGAGVVLIGMALVQPFFDKSISSMVAAQVSTFVAQVEAMKPGAKIDAASLVSQLPSAIAIVAAFMLWLSLLAEKRICEWFSITYKRRSTLLTFKVPSFFIWLSIASIAGSFWHHEIEGLREASLNIFNFAAVTYFLQGMCVVAAYFRKQKIGLFWQMFLYVFICLQLFFAVSLLGLVDFWLDFRLKLAPKLPQTLDGVEK